MLIYLLHEKYYENHDLHLDLQAHNVYAYRTYEGAVQRIVDETGKSTEEVKRFFPQVIIQYLMETGTTKLKKRSCYK